VLYLSALEMKKEDEALYKSTDTLLLNWSFMVEMPENSP